MNLEELSRVLCKADGFEPDQHVLAFVAHEYGPKGHIIVRQTMPSWCLYQNQAMHALRLIAEPV